MKPVLIDFEDLLFELLISEDELLEILYAYADVVRNHGMIDEHQISQRVYLSLCDPITEEYNEGANRDFKQLINACVGAISKLVRMHAVDFTSYNEFTITEQYAIILH